MRAVRSWSSGALLGAFLLGTMPLGAAPASAAFDTCLTGSTYWAGADPVQIRVTRTAIAAACPCAQFDGSAGKGRRAYKRCAKRIINTLVTAGALRAQCSATVRRMTIKSTCGFARTSRAVVCVREALSTGALSCGIRTPASGCRSAAGVDIETRCSAATHCIDAADTNGDLRIAAPGDSGKCASAQTAPTPHPAATPGPLDTGADGRRLAQLLNQYRIANGKPALPLSRAMMATAVAHIADLTAYPSTDSGACTPHSWSKNGGSLYTGCCYTMDHAQADCMWRKPREISSGLGFAQYPGAGYEIALRGTVGGTPEQVLEAFVNSAPHRAVMLSTDGWEFLDAHPAMGAAMGGGYAVIWFGDATDPAN